MDCIENFNGSPKVLNIQKEKIAIGFTLNEAKEEVLGYFTSESLCKGIIGGYGIITTNKRIIGRKLSGTMFLNNAERFLENLDEARHLRLAKTLNQHDAYLCGPLTIEENNALLKLVDTLKSNCELDFELIKSEIIEIEIKNSSSIWHRGKIEIKLKSGNSIKLTFLGRSWSSVNLPDMVNRFLSDKKLKSLNSQGVSQMSELMKAAAEGDINSVKNAVRDGADINGRSAGNWTPLIVAAQNGHLEIVRFLIEKGADFDAENAYTETALCLAKSNGHKETSELLEKLGAKP
jgi:hypothetical protein